MSKCTSGCPTQDCPSYGACLRRKSMRVAYCNSVKGMDLTAQKKWDRELALYKSARDQGIQPAGTGTSAIRSALDKSDAKGTAFDAGA